MDADAAGGDVLYDSVITVDENTYYSLQMLKQTYLRGRYLDVCGRIIYLDSD